MATLILVFILLIAALVIALLFGVSPDLPIKNQFHAVLIFTIAIGYSCLTVACSRKNNVLKINILTGS